MTGLHVRIINHLPSVDKIFVMFVGNNILHNSVATLNIGNHDTIAPLVDVLEKLSKTLAADEESR